MSNCRRCVTEQMQLTSAEAEVHRLARLMSRTKKPDRLALLKEQVELQKQFRAEARANIETGHDCDTRLSDEHWTRRTA